VSQPFIGEIRMVGFSFAPAGWAFCDGQLIPIAENDALFVLIGTTYGGDGQETFALPNLQSRIPIHAGTGSSGINHQLAEMGGTESVTLTTQQIPTHSHAMLAIPDNATQPNPGNNLIARTPSFDMYVQDTPDQAMAATAITPLGGSQPHENMMPFLVINFIISLFGIFPTQT
jgi:microcystin-dependent protein